MLPESDRIRLRHMLEAAEQAVAFASGRNRAELDANRLLSFALVRALEIIGEAASKVTDRPSRITDRWSRWSFSRRLHRETKCIWN